MADKPPPPSDQHVPNIIQSILCDFGGEYCTCLVEDNLDINAKPYRELGNKNGYSTAVNLGSC